jgi:tRNA pseudouridine synthase 8/2,5-diamino-6-(5-phospho-D-ribitylamino)-pyrimidin-4(3H)-one deaminase
MRWRDRTLIDIFSNEFRDREEAYYRKSIMNGKVLLNDKVADIDTIVRNGDLITHKIHRHEPAVSSKPIQIVKETDELLVIDKPAGMPVHPTGRYRFNSVTKILKIENGLHVHPCNRLDRLTSGLMFLAKSPQGADNFVEQLKNHQIFKEYIARVKGDFPNGETIIEEPVNTIEPRLGLNYIDRTESGKTAKTVFQKISYDGETSIVKCKPLTGRTHQIRVHLQYLGYPIANDPIYSNAKVWGEDLGKAGSANLEDVMIKLNEIGKSKSASSWFYPESSSGELLLNKQCDVCDTELYSDPGPNDLELWLHAYKYSSVEDEWSYQTEFPDWALEKHIPNMKLAIEEASKCEETTTAFSVGAVLVNDGEILSTGYSRELPGNTHAEQCALDKFFAKTGKREIPENTDLYTTMEPCSLRLSGNLPCCDRILEFKDQFRNIFVGVLEPDTFVAKNIGLQKLEENGINYIKIPGYEDEILQIAFRGHEGHES